MLSGGLCCEGLKENEERNGGLIWKEQSHTNSELLISIIISHKSKPNYLHKTKQNKTALFKILQMGLGALANLAISIIMSRAP